MSQMTFSTCKLVLVTCTVLACLRDNSCIVSVLLHCTFWTILNIEGCSKSIKCSSCSFSMQLTHVLSHCCLLMEFKCVSWIGCSPISISQAGRLVGRLSLWVAVAAQNTKTGSYSYDTTKQAWDVLPTGSEQGGTWRDAPARSSSCNHLSENIGGTQDKENLKSLCLLHEHKFCDSSTATVSV